MPTMTSNKDLTIDYLINHAYRYAASICSDLQTRGLFIEWRNGDELFYSPEICQDLPCLRRMIQHQKAWMRATGADPNNDPTYAIRMLQDTSYYSRSNFFTVEED